MLTDRLLLVSIVSSLALLAIVWLAARIQTKRRNQGLAQGFADSTRSHLRFERTVSADGFVAHFEPTPEPFARFQLVYQGGATVDPIGLLMRALRGHRDKLLIRCLLLDRPAAELVWERGRIPERALARRARITLWVQRRAELIESEYAVRGADTAALEHVFIDLQARFGALLDSVSVVADREDVHIEILMRAASLRASEAPALVTTIRSLGRAALRR